MVWGPQIIQGIAKIRGEVAWALARVLLILSHRGQTLTHCPASKEKGFYSTGLTLAELPSSGAGGLSYYLKFFTPMFKSVVSGRGVLCNSEGDTPSPQMLYGGFHNQRLSLTLLSLPIWGYFPEPVLHWGSIWEGFL